MFMRETHLGDLCLHLSPQTTRKEILSLSLVSCEKKTLFATGYFIRPPNTGRIMSCPSSVRPLTFQVPSSLIQLKIFS